MKKCVRLLTSLALTLSLLLGSALGAGLQSFSKVASYQSGQFTDVLDSAWYAENVRTAYELGLVDGTSDTTFSPDTNLTLAQAVKLACVLHATYYDADVSALSQGTSWYEGYVAYAQQNGILSAGFSNYNAAATRAQFVQILSAAFPDEALAEIGDVQDGAIPDVQEGAGYADAVYRLYRAGVLTGGAGGVFYPDKTIRRSEATAIVTRMADESLRVSVTLIKRTELSSSEIYEQCTPAVFYIVVYNRYGTATATGSGVFIGENGEAVTNYHVIEGAHYAKITTSDGKTYDVLGCYGYSKDYDLAYLQIDGTGFSYLDTTLRVLKGETVYAIGSPHGVQNTMSTGVISAESRNYAGINYIQTTTEIAHGSSGGALINSYGELMGITTAYIEGEQTIYLAVPLTYLSQVTQGTVQTLSEIATAQESAYSAVSTYDGFYPAPDFGAYVGAKVHSSETKDGTVAYYYAASDFQMSPTAAINGYFALLERNGFSYVSGSEGDNYTVLYYVNGSYGIYVGFGGIDEATESYVVISLATS